jgi:biotin operon repressor
MTAVEKFIEQLEAQGESWENVSIGRIQISINVEDYLKLIEQAKEMEKEQMGYSEEDVIKIVEKSRETGLTAEYLLLTFKQQEQ